MRFMLSPKAHNAFEKCNDPTIKGIVNAPESSFFCKRDLVAIALQCCILSSSTKVTYLLFATRSFINMA